MFTAPTSTPRFGTPVTASASSSPSTPPLSGPLPIGFDPKRSYLPSSEISKHTLKSVDQVLRENNRYMDDLVKNVGTLCQVLARDAFFGKDVLIKCTPGGKNAVGLPRSELFSLKTTMFNMFPKYRTCPTQFESTWKVYQKCLQA